MTRGAPRDPTRCSGDRTRPGRRRHADGARPRTRSPATTSSSASGSTSTSRASSTATSARPTSRPRSTWSSFARRPACATTRRRSATGSPAEVAEPDRRAWLDAQLVALETPGRRPRRRRAAVPRARRALLRLRRPAVPTTRSTRPPRGSTRSCPGDAPLSDRLAAWDRAVRDPARSAAGGRRLAGRPLPRPGGRDRSACPTARTCGSRFVSGQPWAAYNWYDGGRRSRVDINTDLPVAGLDPVHDRSPTRPTRATTSSTPGRRPTSSTGGGRLEASILLINTPECLISEGLADLGLRFAVAARRPASTCSSSCTSGPACRSPPIRPPPATRPS